MGYDTSTMKMALMRWVCSNQLVMEQVRLPQFYHYHSTDPF